MIIQVNVQIVSLILGIRHPILTIDKGDKSDKITRKIPRKFSPKNSINLENQIYHIAQITCVPFFYK